MMNILKQYYKLLSQRQYREALVVGGVFLLASIVMSDVATIYATEHASNAVTDIILDHIFFVDVSILFVYGGLAFVIGLILLCLARPHWIPFVVKSVSLFVFIRAFFVILTHIGLFPDQILLNPINVWRNSFLVGADYFFSGHTGLPFLMALILWDRLILRIVFLSL